MYLKILAVLSLLLSLQACGNGSSGSQQPVGAARFANWSTVQKITVGDSTTAATAVDGMVLYTDQSEGLSVVDASNLERVSFHRKVVDPMHWVENHGAYDLMQSVSVTGDVASVAVVPACLGWCAGRFGEIRLYDIQERSQATYLSTVVSPIFPEAQLAEGNYLYVTGTDYAWLPYLAVVDVSDPKQPRQTGMVRIGGGSGNLAKAGDRLFISQVGAETTWPDNYKRIQVIDVSNPAAPVMAGPPSGYIDYIEAGYRYSPIVVTGDVAYVSDSVNGLYVVDMGDITSPSLVTTIAQPGTVQAMASYGNYLYLACGTGGLRVYDIKDPKAPLLVKEIPTSTSIRFVAVTNGKGIYISDGAAGSASKQELTVFYVDDAT